MPTLVLVCNEDHTVQRLQREYSSIQYFIILVYLLPVQGRCKRRAKASSWQTRTSVGLHPKAFQVIKP